MLEETTDELVETRKLLNEHQAAADDGYYIHVPVERECLTCPKLELVTDKQRIDFDDSTDIVTSFHKCKHLNFCKTIRKNWLEVQNKNCADMRTQN